MRYGSTVQIDPICSLCHRSLGHTRFVHQSYPVRWGLSDYVLGQPLFPLGGGETAADRWLFNALDDGVSVPISEFFPSQDRLQTLK